MTEATGSPKRSPPTGRAMRPTNQTRSVMGWAIRPSSPGRSVMARMTPPLSQGQSATGPATQTVRRTGSPTGRPTRTVRRTRSPTGRPTRTMRRTRSPTGPAIRTMRRTRSPTSPAIRTERRTRSPMGRAMPPEGDLSRRWCCRRAGRRRRSRPVPSTAHPERPHRDTRRRPRRGWRSPALDRHPPGMRHRRPARLRNPRTDRCTPLMSVAVHRKRAPQRAAGSR